MKHENPIPLRKRWLERANRLAGPERAWIRLPNAKVEPKSERSEAGEMKSVTLDLGECVVHGVRQLFLYDSTRCGPVLLDHRLEAEESKPLRAAGFTYGARVRVRVIVDELEAGEP